MRVYLTRPSQRRHNSSLAIVAAALFLFLQRPLAQTQTSALPAAEDSHEGLTVSVQPWTDPARYKERFAKKSPFTAGIAAVYVTFQNDSGDTLRVNLERIRLLVTYGEDSRQQLTPLSPGDVADRMLSGNTTDPTARRSRIPLPIGKPKVGRTKEWTELEKAARDAGMPGGMVAPHSKLQGLLYFDMADQFDLLSTAHMYVPEVLSLEKNKTLFYFDVDLAKRVTR